VPNIVIHACLNILENMTLLKQCSPQNGALLFMFQSITLKYLNRLTSIDIFNCLGGLQVTQQTAVRNTQGSIPGSIKKYYVCFFVLLFLCFILFCPKHNNCHKMLQSFCNVNLFSTLNILKNK